MLPVALLYVLAMLFPADQAVPLYSDTVLTPRKDLLQKLVTEVDEGQRDEQSALRHVKPILWDPDSDLDSWSKGDKEALQHENANELMDDLKAVMLKLAAVDNLHSQSYLRSEQHLPKPNKRACFWKYCVTN